jgi:hypothetical protein
MPNPTIQAEINYDPAPEIPLYTRVLVRKLTLLKRIHFAFPNSSLRRAPGSWKLELPPILAFLLLFSTPGLPGRTLWNLEITLFFTSTVLKLDAGSW